MSEMLQLFVRDKKGQFIATLWVSSGKKYYKTNNKWQDLMGEKSSVFLARLYLNFLIDLC